MIVKICGLRMLEHAQAAANAGADLIGLVFAPSRRRITPAEATALVQALRADSRPVPLIVGLFVHEEPMTINAIADQVGLDLVQLSGTESVSMAQAIQRPLIKSLRMDGSVGETEWQALATKSIPPTDLRLLSPRLLIDAHIPGAYGGTGATADWTRAARLAAQFPLLLAGGLTPLNVAAAINYVRPWGVDVSSGVEIAGAKDSRQIEAFIAAARAA